MEPHHKVKVELHASSGGTIQSPPESQRETLYAYARGLIYDDKDAAREYIADHSLDLGAYYYHSLRAELSLFEMAPASALQDAECAHREKPGDENALVQQGAALIQLGELKRAKQILANKKLNSAYADSTRAFLALNEKRWADVESFANSALNKDPSFKSVGPALFIARWRLRKDPCSLEPLQRFALDGTNGQMAVLIACILHEAGRPADAVDVLERAVKRDPANPRLWSQCIEIWAATGDQHSKVDSAIAALEDYSHLFDSYGRNLLKSGKLEDAESYCVSRLTENPWDRGAGACLAAVYWKQGRFGKSLRAMLVGKTKGSYERMLKVHKPPT